MVLQQDILNNCRVFKQKQAIHYLFLQLKQKIAEKQDEQETVIARYFEKVRRNIFLTFQLLKRTFRFTDIDI